MWKKFHITNLLCSVSWYVYLSSDNKTGSNIAFLGPSVIWIYTKIFRENQLFNSTNSIDPVLHSYSVKVENRKSLFYIQRLSWSTFAAASRGVLLWLTMRAPGAQQVISIRPSQVPSLIHRCAWPSQREPIRMSPLISIHCKKAEDWE